MIAWRGKAKAVFDWIAVQATTIDETALSRPYWETHWHIRFIHESGRN
jgi:hypothetical protein